MQHYCYHEINCNYSFHIEGIFFSSYSLFIHYIIYYYRFAHHHYASVTIELLHKAMSSETQNLRYCRVVINCSSGLSNNIYEDKSKYK